MGEAKDERHWRQSDCCRDFLRIRPAVSGGRPDQGKGGVLRSLALRMAGAPRRVLSMRKAFFTGRPMAAAAMATGQSFRLTGTPARRRWLLPLPIRAPA